MNATRVTAYRCADCGVLSALPSEKLREAFTCTRCGEIYEDRDEAEECCADEVTR